MIWANMKQYQCKRISDTVDSYGLREVEDASPILLNIKEYNHTVTDDIRFNEVEYIGLTKDIIDDSYIVVDGDTEYKVIHFTPTKRYNEVFLKKI